MSATVVIEIPREIEDYEQDLATLKELEQL